MVGKRVVSDSSVDGLIRIAGAFGSEFPDGPFLIVLGIEKLDELVERVTIRALRVGPRRSRSKLPHGPISKRTQKEKGPGRRKT